MRGVWQQTAEGMATRSRVRADDREDALDILRKVPATRDGSGGTGTMGVEFNHNTMGDEAMVENGNCGINDLLYGIQQISEQDVARAIKDKEAEMSVVKAELGRLRELQKIVQTKTAKKPRKKRAKVQPQAAVTETEA